jgi:hypothetical protein
MSTPTEQVPKSKEQELRERFQKFEELVCKKSKRQIADQRYRQPSPNDGGRVA